MYDDIGVSELQAVYNEMDAEGRKGMAAAAEKLLDVQKTLEAMSARKKYRNRRFLHIAGYFAMSILLVISASVFWVFLISPALLMAGISPLVMARIIITALLGLFCLGSGLVDFVQRRIKVPWRLLIIAAGLACTDPHILTDLAGMALVALLITVQVIQKKNEKTSIFI